MYDLNDTEYYAVLKLNADYREAHFRDKFRTFKELFLLVTDEGPCMLSGDNEEGDEVAAVLPIWPHPRYATVFADAMGYVNARVQNVSLAVFMESWVPLLGENQVCIGFMPLPFKDDADEGDFNIAPACSLEEAAAPERDTNV